MLARSSAILIALALTAYSAQAQSPDAPAGAAACSGCHANSKNVETPAPRLIGREPADVIAAMLAFKTGARPGTIMDRIAKGFSEDEIKTIAAWYGAQKD